MVKIIILVVIAVLILSFFGITIQSIVESPAGQANFGYIWQLVMTGWDWFVNFINMGSQSLTKAVSATH